MLQYLDNFVLFFINFFFYRHDVGSKLGGHTFDPSEVDSLKTGRNWADQTSAMISGTLTRSRKKQLANS